MLEVATVVLVGLIWGGPLSSPAFFIMKEVQLGWILGIGGFLLGAMVTASYLP